MIRAVFAMLILMTLMAIFCKPSPALGQELIRLAFERKKGFQKIDHIGQSGSTEFLILSNSHGNPGDVKKKISEISGGSWLALAYAGNDDKSIEVWTRYLQEDQTSGTINAKSGKGDLSIIVYDRRVKVNYVIQKKLLKPSKIAVINISHGSHLIVAASDSGGNSTQANYSYGRRDDPTFIYFFNGKSFIDKSARKIRGALLSLSIAED